jgi:hypothetical protein
MGGISAWRDIHRDAVRLKGDLKGQTMQDIVSNIVILAFGLYLSIFGFLLIIAPQHARKDPIWRSYFALFPIAEGIYLKFAKPLGVICISAGILLVILTLRIFTGT